MPAAVPRDVGGPPSCGLPHGCRWRVNAFSLAYATGFLMPEPPSLTQHVAAELACLRGGDAAARGRLMELTERRLRAICATMLHRLPRVERWEQTGDIFSEAAARLYQSLETVQ